MLTQLLDQRVMPIGDIIAQHADNRFARQIRQTGCAAHRQPVRGVGCQDVALLVHQSLGEARRAEMQLVKQRHVKLAGPDGCSQIAGTSPGKSHTGLRMRPVERSQSLPHEAIFPACLNEPKPDFTRLFQTKPLGPQPGFRDGIQNPQRILVQRQYRFQIDDPARECWLGDIELPRRRLNRAFLDRGHQNPQMLDLHWSDMPIRHCMVN